MKPVNRDNGISHLESDHGGNVTLGLGIGILLHGGVEVGYVGLVVLGVVQSHDFRVDDWGKCARIVWQGGCDSTSRHVEHQQGTFTVLD